MAHRVIQPIPHMMRQTFLRSLPKMWELGGKDDCPICCQTYKAPTAPAPGMVESLYSMIFPRAPEPKPAPGEVRPELAVRLPCQHVLGSRCITRWVRAGQTTCPYCVQQLFIPSRYPVSAHPLWKPLIERIGEYGMMMDQDGQWLWDQEKGAAMLSAEDIRAVLPLAQQNAAILESHVGFAADSIYTLQRLAASILTLHLREAVLCLQLQAWGVKIPAFEETRLEPEFPFLLPKKQHTDALFKYFQRQKGFDPETWESDRALGYVPYQKWK